MKKHLLVLFAMVMLILCACRHSEQGKTEPTETTAPVQTTAPAETTIPTESTVQQTIPPTTVPQPSETVSYDLTVEDWYVEPEYLSYKEYFSKDRQYLGGGNAWLKMEGDTGSVYHASWEDDGLVITSDATGEKYLVPDSKECSEFGLAGTDGKFAYLWMNKEYRKMNLATGENEVVFSAEEIVSCVTLDNLVSYYIASRQADGKEYYEVGRVYLPDGHIDVLHTFPAENVVASQVSLWRYSIQSNLGDVKWIMINPAFTEILEKELNDPDSEFRVGYYDNSEYWEAENGIEMLFTSGYYMLLDEIENAYDARAQLMGIYNQKTGKYTEKEGVFDTCYYGSDFGHDHFSPEITETTEPIFVKERWFSVKQKAKFALCDPDHIGEDGTYVDHHLSIISDATSTPYLYFDQEGKYTRVTDIPIQEAVNTSKSIICVTADNRVMAMSFDGKETALLYRSVYGEIKNLDISYYGNYAAFMDGDYIILIDLVKQQYREVVYNPDLSYFYLSVLYETGTYDVAKVPEIYFDITAGLAVDGYVIDLRTGEVDEGYRL